VKGQLRDGRRTVYAPVSLTARYDDYIRSCAARAARAASAKRSDPSLAGDNGGPMLEAALKVKLPHSSSVIERASVTGG
jgi:hypothetical protein